MEEKKIEINYWELVDLIRMNERVAVIRRLIEANGFVSTEDVIKILDLYEIPCRCREEEVCNEAL